MGLLMSRLLDLFRSSRSCRILMVGLDGAGKTTILYKLKLGEVVTTIPTIGFNVETVEYKNISMSVWDVGGQERIRPLWRHYFHNAAAIIFAVDSNDPERFRDARQELELLLNTEELKDCPVLVLANKQDLPQAASVSKVAESLGLEVHPGRAWYVQGTCAINTSGIYDGLDWLAKHVITQ